MPLDAAGYQVQIIAEVGDDAAGTLAASMDRLWTSADSQPTLYGQYLYAKRAAIDVMLAKARNQVDFKALDRSVSLGQIFTHLQAIRQDTQDQIDQEVISAAAGGASGELTTTAPIAPPPGSLIDANDRAYRGDAYRTRNRRFP